MFRYKIYTSEDKKWLEDTVTGLMKNGAELREGETQIQEALEKNDKGRMVKVRKIIYIQRLIIPLKSTTELGEF